MDRRKFLLNCAVAAAGTVLCNQTIFARRPSKFGLQLYTVRKQMESDFEVTLRRAAALGFKEVEFAGYFNRPASEIKKILKKHGLTAPSAHVGIDAFRNDFQKAIDDARIIGHRYLVLAYLPPEARKSLDDYRRLARSLNEAGEKCRAAGLRLAYHNHDFEFQPFEGKLPFDLLLAETEPRAVEFEMDLYWITKAGFDPTVYFAKHPGRFPLVHVKDMDATPSKTFTEVGKGVIDFKKIFAKAGEAGIRHYFVEQDETPGDPFDSLKISLDYLRRAKL